MAKSKQYSDQIYADVFNSMLSDILLHTTRPYERSLKESSRQTIRAWMTSSRLGCSARDGLSFCFICDALGIDAQQLRAMVGVRVELRGESESLSTRYFAKRLFDEFTRQLSGYKRNRIMQLAA